MATNWVFEQFCIVQEDGANILIESSNVPLNIINLLSLQEFNSTVWTDQTATGTG
jgi:hypothetical protein|tara:strand:+ start:437 stop:601 length:165 start_codon:yes stop_codon:yes gene_type:complete